jgi:LDH2 family malate/lactate/ureidoglycolate dehydrogenase
MSNDIIVNAAQLLDFCTSLFKSIGMSEKDAFVNADNLVDADLKGHPSHGVSRMAIHLKRIRLGCINIKSELKTVSDKPSVAVYDACNSMGPCVSVIAMEHAMEKARQTGISFVTVKNSNHYGTAGYYVEPAIKQGMIGLSMTNTPARMAPWASKDPYFGTNPFAVGIPADKQLPILADMATTLVARGKIVIAAQNKVKIPLGWGMTRDGEPTTDPEEALVGSVAPFGNYKGSAISLLINVLTGMLSGSSFGPYIKDMYADFDSGTYTSHAFGAIDIDAFIPGDLFRSSIDKMILDVKQSSLAKNATEIFLPGEIELRNRESRLKDGVPLSQPIIEDLKREGVLCKVPFTLC